MKDRYITNIANLTLSLSMQVIAIINYTSLKPRSAQLDNQCLMQAEQPKKDILVDSIRFISYIYIYIPRNTQSK